MRPVKLGIVGLGAIGRSHLRSLAQADFVEIAGLADTDETRLAWIRARFPYKTYPDHHALLHDSRCEALLIATPHPFHAPIACDAAAAGVHVLTEKPMAVTVVEADRMIEAAERAGVLLGVMYQRRLEPANLKAKEIVESGVLGEVWEFDVEATQWFRLQAYYDSEAWRGTWEGEGGGVLANQASHDLDICQWLHGLPDAVSAALRTRAHRIESENSAHAILEYEGGPVGFFRTSTVDPLGRQAYAIRGELGRLAVKNGMVRLCRYGASLRSYVLEGEAARFSPQWEEIPVEPAGNERFRMVKAFCESIREGAPLVASGVDARKTLELSNAIYLSGARRQRVTLPCDRSQIDALFRELRAQTPA